jgi:hypothetical protein
MQMEQQLIAREDRPVRLLLGIGSSFILSQNSGSQPAIYEAIYPRSRLIDTGAGVLVKTITERTANASRISISNQSFGTWSGAATKVFRTLTVASHAFLFLNAVSAMVGSLTYQLWANTSLYLDLRYADGVRRAANGGICKIKVLQQFDFKIWAQVLPRPSAFTVSESLRRTTCFLSRWWLCAIWPLPTTGLSTKLHWRLDVGMGWVPEPLSP